MNIRVTYFIFALFACSSCHKDFNKDAPQIQNTNYIKLLLVEQNADKCLINNRPGVAVDLFGHIINSLDSTSGAFLARIHVKLGASYFNTNDIPNSIIHLRSGLELYFIQDKNVLTDDDINFLHSGTILLANCYRIKGQFETALQCLDNLEKSIKKSTSPKHSNYTFELMSDIFTWKALVYFDLGQFEKSIGFQFRAIQTIEKGGGSNCHIYENFSALGRLLMHEGDVVKSEKYHRHALAIISDCFGDSSIIYTEELSNLGLTYLESKRFKEALECFAKAHQRTEKHFTRRSVQYAFSLNNLADAYSGVGEYAEAIQDYNQALDIFVNLNYLDEACVIYHNLGITHFNKRDYLLAEEYYNHSLELSNEFRSNNNIYNAYTYQRLGQLYLEQNKFSLATTKYKKAIEELYQDTMLYQGPLDMQSNILSKAELFKSFYKKGLCELYDYYEGGNYFQLIESVASFQKSIRLLDVLRKQYSFEKMILSLNEESFPLIENYLYSVLQLSYKDPSYENDNKVLEGIDREKYSALRSILHATKPNRYSGLPNHCRKIIDSLYKSIRSREIYISKIQRSNKNQIAIIENQLFETTYSLDTLVHSLKQMYPEFNKSLQTFSFYDIHEIQALLPDSTSIIEYFHNDSVTIIFAINKNEYKVVHSFNNQDLLQQKNQLKRSIMFSNNYAFRLSSEFLFDILIRPVSNIIFETKSIIFIPGGFFSDFPFEVLSDRNKHKTLNNKEIPDYLIKHYDISYFFSLNLWGDHMQQAISSEDVLWDNEFSGFAPMSSINQRNDAFFLPHSGHEVQNIAEIFEANGNTSRSYINENSTEFSFQKELKTSRIVHIASHSHTSNNPEDYQIYFYKTDTVPLREKALHQFLSEGRLFLFEIYNLEVNADLVTLSVCSSGAGESNTGEGITSLSHGFYYSGARNILYTLWDVSDCHSSAFMTTFYHYINNGFSYARALRKTKIDFIDSNYKLPVFWSCFLLNG